MHDIVAIDTEFERRRTYRPILSIVQIKYNDNEPIVFDVFKQKNENLSDLIKILSNNDIVKVIHSARQDVEAIFYRFHIAIKNIFDTQIAYSFVGHEANVSYSKLVECFLNKKILKKKTLQTSNWLKRPLSEEQIFYAKQDVLYLKEIYNKMMDYFLENNSQYNQFVEKCLILEDKKNYSFNPWYMWKKIKHNFINNVNFNLIKELFITREKLAYKFNLPRDFVLNTKDLINFANKKDISFLERTHYKIDKNIFIEILNKN